MYRCYNYMDSFSQPSLFCFCPLQWFFQELAMQLATTKFLDISLLTGCSIPYLNTWGSAGTPPPISLNIYYSLCSLLSVPDIEPSRCVVYRCYNYMDYFSQPSLFCFCPLQWFFQELAMQLATTKFLDIGFSTTIYG